jgi:UDP-GlcNAc:undecaprenyl-phosphate GlcNAc-1-phosphate transferase
MRMDVPNPLLLAAFLVLCVAWYLLTDKRARAVAFFRRLRGAPVPAKAVLRNPE